MNERNVEALAAILKRVGFPYPRNTADTGWHDDSDYTDFAREIIESGGVLVPSALSEAECLAIEDAGECFPEEDDKMARAMRAEMEKIAKRET